MFYLKLCKIWPGVEKRLGKWCYFSMVFTDAPLSTWETNVFQEGYGWALLLLQASYISIQFGVFFVLHSSSLRVAVRSGGQR